MRGWLWDAADDEVDDITGHHHVYSDKQAEARGGYAWQTWDMHASEDDDDEYQVHKTHDDKGQQAAFHDTHQSMAMPEHAMRDSPCDPDRDIEIPSKPLKLEELDIMSDALMKSSMPSSSSAWPTGDEETLESLQCAVCLGKFRSVSWLFCCGTVLVHL